MANQRKNYFVDKNFQTKFIIRFCLIVIVSSVLIAGLVFLFSQGSTTVAIENTKVQVKQTSDFILPIIIEILFLVTAFSALATATLALFSSHKISGPLFRIQREVEKIVSGDLSANFSLRGKDQLQELAKSLKAMNNNLKKTNKLQKELISDLKKKLGKQIDSLEVDKIISELYDSIHSFKS